MQTVSLTPYRSDTTAITIAGGFAASERQETYDITVDKIVALVAVHEIAENPKGRGKFKLTKVYVSGQDFFGVTETPQQIKGIIAG